MTDKDEQTFKQQRDEAAAALKAAAQELAKQEILKQLGGLSGLTGGLTPSTPWPGNTTVPWGPGNPLTPNPFPNPLPGVTPQQMQQMNQLAQQWAKYADVVYELMSFIGRLLPDGFQLVEHEDKHLSIEPLSSPMPRPYSKYDHSGIYLAGLRLK